MFLAALDWCLFVLHAALIAVNLFGWAVPRLRGFTLGCQLFTWLSWLGLGLVYGLGYCPLTDWHWRVKTARGQGPLPQSLVKYYLDAWTGANSDPFWIDVLTVSAFTVATLLNSALMWRGHRRRQQATRQASQHTVT